MTGNKKHTFIDLFAGCGGMSLGFEMANFKNLLAIDSWEDALTTYSYNRRNSNTLCADLSKLNPKLVRSEYGIDSVDVIIGGPPCQGFSVAGKRLIDDDRNTLYRNFVAFVKEFQPKAFVMENVPNILNIGGGLVKKQILDDFESIGYKVSCKVLIASDYGVPQNRRRAFFIGFKDGQEYMFEECLKSPIVSSYEAIGDLPEESIVEGGNYPIEPISDFQIYARTNSKGVYNHEITIHTEQTKRIIGLVPDGGNYKDLPESLQKPSFTIDCGHNHHFHYKYNRVPTVRESARLQSFPDSFIFVGNKGSQLKQVGNSVPPLMAKAIAEQLNKQLL